MTRVHDFGSNLSDKDRFFAFVNSFSNYIHFIKLYKRRYKNSVSIILNVLRKNYPIKAVSNSGDIFLFHDYQEVYNNLIGLHIDQTQDLVYFDELKLYGGKTNGDVFHVFEMNEYSFLPVDDKEVIDIGANIGDSSIYFARRGASKVIAVEPDRISYDYAEKNIITNGFSKVVNLVWAGCGSQDNPSTEKFPQFLTLETLIKKFCSFPQILKVDCEGCEYAFILNASHEDLNRFSHIQIEYHFGYQNLKTKLEDCGFEVSYTQPSYFIPMNKNRTSSLNSGTQVCQGNRMYMGWLYATRRP